MRYVITHTLRRLTCLGVLGLSLIANVGSATPLRIAVAANFTPVLEVLIADFEQQTGIKSQLISASSGVLFQQISHGAPFDLLLCADDKRPAQLERNGLALTGSRQTYALGKLAFYNPTHPNISLAAMAEHARLDEKFAIANPELAPYGMAAKQALTQLNLWFPLREQLIIGQNINQTFMQIHTGAVQMGIVALSQLKLNNLPGEPLADELYHPIQQQLVIMSKSAQIHQARIFVQFLLNEQNQKRIAEFGYGVQHAMP